MSSRKTTGFTIVELLVVITIIGILMALIFPAVGIARNAAKKANCINNQGQIGKAVLTYTTKRGYFPKHLNTKNNEDWPWAANIMRELGRGDLADGLQASGPAARSERVDILICPADLPVTVTDNAISYVANAGKGSDTDIADGIFFKDLEVSLAYVASNDGTSTTLMISERVNDSNPTKKWTDTGVTDTAITWGGSASKPSSKHSGGFVVTFCDGHTEFLSNEIFSGSPAVYDLIMTPNGGSAQGILDEADLRN